MERREIGGRQEESEWCGCHETGTMGGVRRDTSGGVIYDVETAGGDDGADGVSETVASETVGERCVQSMWRASCR